MEEAITQILEGNRAKKIVIQKKLGLLFEIGKDVFQTLRGGFRVWILATPSRQPLAEQLALFFHSQAPDDVGPPSVLALPITAPPDTGDASGWNFYRHALASACKKGDLCLVLTSTEKTVSLETEVARLTKRGVWTVVFTSRLAKIRWKDRCERVLNLCTDSDIALMEMQLVFGHLLARYVGEKLEGTPDPVFDKDGMARDSGTYDALSLETVNLVPEETSDAKVEEGSEDEAEPKVTSARTAKEEPFRTAIRFSCEQCGEVIFAEGRHKGKRGRCPKCSARFQVPDVDDELLVATGIVERRRAERFTVTDCAVRYDRVSFPDASSYQAEFPLCDISMVGLRFLKQTAVATECDIKSGDSLFVSLDVPAFLDPLSLRGKVLRINGHPNRMSWEVSLEITGYDGESEAKLKRLTENNLLRDIARA